MPKMPMRLSEAQVGGEVAMPRRKLTVSDAAQHTGVSTSYFNKLRTMGGGPVFFKIGTRVVYDLADLDQWLDQHRRRSTSDLGASAEPAIVSTQEAA